ncbi:MAG: glycosyltransferase family 87 protein [Planctomycetota bacterium]
MGLELKNRMLVWLAAAVGGYVLLNIAIVAVLVADGDSVSNAYKATAPAYTKNLLQPSRNDSWKPMLTAYNRHIENPSGDMYAVFFDEHVKFQYPPTSLVAFDFLPRSLSTLDNGEVGLPLLLALGKISRVIVILTAILSAVVLEIGRRRLNPLKPVHPVSTIASLLLSCALGLAFYPLQKAHWLGQVQVFLDAAVALAFLFHLLGWKASSGVCFGFCCLVKPQFGVVLLWSVLRRQWRFTLGLLALFVPGLIVSLWRFGLQNHLRYLDVMQTITRHGEAYWPNQSMNGLVNRLLGNGEAVDWSFTEFAPFHPVVYSLTVASSLVILVLALWPRKHWKTASGGSIDLAAAVAAATIASPVAWEHHYGIFVPVVALLVPELIRTRPLGRVTAPLLLLAYLAMANVLLRPRRLFSNGWFGLLGSHLFLGGIIVFGLLLVVRAHLRTAAVPAIAPPARGDTRRGVKDRGAGARGIAPPAD